MNHEIISKESLESIQEYRKTVLLMFLTKIDGDF